MMLQSFETTARPDQGPARLAALRGVMAQKGLAAYLVPRADIHQGEYVAARDERLQWLTGFTGSAGFAIALLDRAAVFIDGRYTVQVKSQVDLAHFTPVAWPETSAAQWLRGHLTAGAVGFDPWLHSVTEIEALQSGLVGAGMTLIPCANLIDAIWQDQPSPPTAPAFAHPEKLAGESAAAKITRIAADLRQKGIAAAVLTLPDSLCWLLNIRGSDVPRNPVVQALGLIYDTGAVTVFAHGNKFAQEITSAPLEDFIAHVDKIEGRVLIDPLTAPYALHTALGARAVLGEDPCKLPKARKNAAEIAATRNAHLRDGAAMVRFMHWFSQQNQISLTEIDVVKALEGFRRETGVLHDLSFDTICGAGPNGAIVHYRVTHESNRKLETGDLLLLDSGAQYQDGTTDITRTFAVSPASPKQRRAYTRVLQGMIAISRVRFPKGVAGAHLDALARYPLWLDGLDYAHGTGHGVGAFLSVHEGPQRISRAAHTPLEVGMILSNEPGVYFEGEFGIRLENLITVIEVSAAQLGFDTLTYAPFCHELVDFTLLSQDERAWLAAYHAEVTQKIGPLLTGAARDWLTQTCAAFH